jgi:membrane protease YdiL (CAAX protease family)
MTTTPTSRFGLLHRILGLFVCDGRLRSGWRVLLYVIVSQIVLFGSSFAAIVLRGQVLFSFVIIRTMGIVLVVWLFRRLLDHRSFVSLGFRRQDWFREFAAGFTLGLVLLAGIFVIEWLGGWASMTGFAWEGGRFGGAMFNVAALLVVNLLVGFTEELDARGYILQNLAEGIRFVPALVVSSLYFGALHLLNPHASLIAALYIAMAGVMLGMAYWATGNLWMPIGLHAAWNWAEGPLFGFPVSGTDMGGLLQLSFPGPEWITGGAFGPEAGITGLASTLVAIILLWAWGQRRRATNS